VGTLLGLGGSLDRFRSLSHLYAFFRLGLHVVDGHAPSRSHHWS
jgi:hypothetical protein